MAGIKQRLDSVPWKPGHINTGEWEFSQSTPDEPSTVATYQAPRPIRIREDREFDLAVPAFETFTTVGDGSTQTFNLSHNLLDTPATEALVLWKVLDSAPDGMPAGQRETPDSIDFEGNSFDYTDSGNVENLFVYYIPRDPAVVEFTKVAPGGGATLEQPLFEVPTAIAHTRDQSKDPLSFDLGRTALQDTVPRKWKIVATVDAPYPVAFEDEEGRGTSATNALLAVPRAQTEARIRGLKDAVKADIAGLD
ncbi:hypothetical protein [Haloarchaeobius salinus]|uniref:hypothetical protein n=1 Tax=Haloarchaeobius salinus TaxID=1198298 RepID=UPI00210B9789|nr:hypothetical protein [Haloarchaeobius salinus]